MPKLSVVIPTFNELKLNFFPTILEQLCSFEDIEVIVSDGGSRDNTLSLAKEYGVQIVNADTNSRAQRLNLGAQKASSEMILFHHPRSIIELDGIKFLIKNSQSLVWGGFTHSFDLSHPLLNFTSWYSSNVRAKLANIVYLDHCIFCRKDIFEKVGPIPEVDIFEDTLLSQMISKYSGRPTILPFKSETSAVRFLENGVFKQAFTNQYLKILFYLGKDHQSMNKTYEKKTSLNSRYKK